MKELIIRPGLIGDLVDSPVPQPGPDDVLIRIEAAGLNPKDWKTPEILGMTSNASDDMAGTVAAVGSNVFEFKAGDRVAAMHPLLAPHGSLAEYGIAPSLSTFRLSDKTTFEEAAAVPLPAMTAALALFRDLGYAGPWKPPAQAEATGPLLVYGAGTAVGLYAVQLAAKAGIHPIIAVAGRSKPYVQTLIHPAKGDVVLDYRDGVETVVSRARSAAGCQPVYRAVDCIAERDSDKFVGGIIDPDAERSFISTVWPCGEGKLMIREDLNPIQLHPMPALPQGVPVEWTSVGKIFAPGEDFGFIFFRYISKGLAEGWLRGVPQEIVPGGLDGVTHAMEKIRNGVNSATRYIVRISDTPGL